jgi:opacity protein-like surface antigen
VKIVCIVFFTCSSYLASAQRFGIELFGGASNYQGDLQQRVYTFNQSKFAFGLGASYALNEHFAVRAMANFGKIQADDKLNKDPLLKKRNLNFKSPITDINVTLQYHILEMQTSRFSPYVFTGLALFRFNPYTTDTVGNKISLQPLGTEGQCLAEYPDRKTYGLTQFSIPLGIGIKFAVNRRMSIGWEISMRKTFTDYLDDVSTSYVDENILRANRGETAVDISYRGDELKDGDLAYPAAGTQRGGSRFKDWYYFSGITATIKFPAGENSDRKKSGTNCPRPVY